LREDLHADLGAEVAERKCGAVETDGGFVEEAAAHSEADEAGDSEEEKDSETGPRAHREASLSDALEEAGVLERI
jgi:hypothetical protein